MTEIHTSDNCNKSSSYMVFAINEIFGLRVNRGSYKCNEISKYIKDQLPKYNQWYFLSCA